MLNLPPIGGVPIGVVPIGVVPIGGVPIGDIPIGGIPIGGIPIGIIGIIDMAPIFPMLPMFPMFPMLTPKPIIGEGAREAKNIGPPKAGSIIMPGRMGVEWLGVGCGPCGETLR
ncbi:hypothetical protein BC937DRAFT_92846 [Endogone sp. FLAS-F59071]|nr:hypothetical protein BC937DRAFT_92846 [Endogone sp. FLAS-F59071]|eukprot:RUS15146.1 hypothetical protein BC937DRAFT_92846 [Endogone sp. FLAS-F59071]